MQCRQSACWILVEAVEDLDMKHLSWFSGFLSHNRHSRCSCWQMPQPAWQTSNNTGCNSSWWRLVWSGLERDILSTKPVEGPFCHRDVEHPQSGRDPKDEFQINFPNTEGLPAGSCEGIWWNPREIYLQLGCEPSVSQLIGYSNTVHLLHHLLKKKLYCLLVLVI